MSAKSWTIRDYEIGDETAIVEIFERVFKKTMGPSESVEHWRWEYADNPVGPMTIKLIWDDERLVGQYAVSPRKIWSCGQERLAALSLDTMTDPDYGRQGIFSGSAEGCYETMTQRNFSFVYGFPNANSIGGFERRLAWKIVMKTPVLVKALDVGELIASKLGVPLLGGALAPASRLLLRAPGFANRVRSQIATRLDGALAEEPTVREFESFGGWADELWLRCREQHQIWVIRDRAFLSWRYDRRPESTYHRLLVDVAGETVGYAVLCIAQREQGLVCFVMDLLVDLEAHGAHDALLDAVETHARSQSCAFVSAMVGPDSPTRGALLRNAYLPLPEKLFPQEMYFGARALGGFGEEELTEPASWQLSWGDVDVL